MVKVSVVVPIYNTEKYIERCLNSLVSQTLHDIEIICVDDGSSDNSALIVEEFIKKDNRIKLIKQKNLKQGAARNNGTKEAVGEYIGFVDSDDWVDIDYYQKLYEAAKKYDADIALAVNVRIGNGKTKKRLKIKEEIFVEDLKDKFEMCNVAKDPCPTNKIYRRALIKEKNINWPQDCYCEDKLYVLQAVYYANGVVTVPSVEYYYYRNPSSTVKTKSKTHIECLRRDKNRAIKDMILFLRKNNALIFDKYFWVTVKEIRLFNIPIFSIKESIVTKKHVLFNMILLKEAKINASAME